MGKLQPRTIATWVKSYSAGHTFRPLRQVIESTLRSRGFQYSEEQLSELSEESAPHVALELQLLLDEVMSDGEEPTFEISSDANDSFFRQIESPYIPLLRELRTMTPDGFECFCSLIVNRLYGTAVVDGGPYDGGIDFYAHGVPMGPDNGPAPLTSRVFLLGQSKRYADNNLVTENDLRSFVGGALRRAHQLRQTHGDRFGLLTPLALAYWITSDFHPSAKVYARELGIWYLNGIGLAQLALRVKLGILDLEKCEAEAKLRKDGRRTISNQKNGSSRSIG